MLQISTTGNDLFQWHENATNTYFNSTIINGANSNNYSPNSITPDTLYYYCIVTDGNGVCPEDTSTISTIYFIDYPTAAFSYSDTALMVNFSNTSINANNYEWNFGDGNFSNMANPIHQYQNTGTYTIYLTAENNCYSDTTWQTITLSTTGILASEDSNLSIYPNPSDGKCFIDIGTTNIGNGILKIYDLNGKIIMEVEISKKITSLNLTGFERGEYMLTFTSNQQKIIKKIVLN